MAESEHPAKTGPARITGTLGLVGLAIGIVIGSGIFKVPGMVFEAAGNDPLIALSFWVIGGAFALTGALTMSEMATMFPRQGGTFVYVNEAYGKYWAFAVGWCSCLVGYPAATAAISHVFGEYAGVALGLQGYEMLLSASIICACAAANLHGSRLSFGFQTLLSGFKVVLVTLFGAALLAAAVEPTTVEVAATQAMPLGFGAVTAGLIAVYWTFDGWPNLVVVAGEVKSPERTLLRSLVGSIALILVLYLVINFGLFRAVSPEVLSGHETPAAAAANAAFGPLGERLLSALVAITTGTSVFGLFVAAPRFIYAIGEAGFFFKAVARLSPKTQAPRAGLAVVFVMAMAYLLSSSFGQTLSVYAFVGLSVEVLAVTALFTLRFKRPDAHRPVRVPLYPIVPLIYGGLCLSLVWGALIGDPLRCLLGAVLMGLTYPVFWVWQKRSASSSPLSS